MSQAMPWVFVVLGAAALLAAFLFVWQSVRAALGLVAAGEAEQIDLRRRELLATKDALMEGLRDLMFDHDAGKLTEKDYQAQEKALRADIRDVMRRLDADVADYRRAAEDLVDAARGAVANGDGEPAPKPSDRPPRPSAESMDDRVICPQCMAPNDPDADACVECCARLTPQDCPNCGTENDADATFCKKCGKKFEADCAEAGTEAEDAS